MEGIILGIVLLITITNMIYAAIAITALIIIIIIIYVKGRRLAKSNPFFKTIKKNRDYEKTKYQHP